MAEEEHSTLAQRLVNHCRQWLEVNADTQLILGYSGGLDSTVLLYALLKAGAQNKLTAVHVHHNLQPLADTWLAYCQQHCRQLGVNFQAEHLRFPGTHNIESRARRERRNVLLKHVPEQGALVLAHHQNDQAETLLLQLFRGAGPQGLSAMQEDALYQQQPVWRPMLQFTRSQLEHIAQHWQLQWVEDPTNKDIEVDRNFIRQQVVPLISQRWQSIVPVLARNAQLQQDAVQIQQEVAEQDWRALSQEDGGICLQGLQQLSPARQRNLLYRWVLKRGWLPPNQKIMRRVWCELIPAKDDAQPQVQWQEGSWLRFRQRLYLLSPQDLLPTHESFEIALTDGAQYQWGRLHITVRKSQEISSCFLPAHWQSILLTPVEKGAKLRINNMRKDVSELWRANRIPPWRRQQLPALWHNDELAAVALAGVSDDVVEIRGEVGWQLEFTWQ